LALFRHLEQTQPDHWRVWHVVNNLRLWICPAFGMHALDFHIDSEELFMDVQEIINQLDQQKTAIEQAIVVLRGAGKRMQGRRVMSPEARAKIAAAQRKRWKAQRAMQKKK
jgi:hypothetical protein